MLELLSLVPGHLLQAHSIYSLALLLPGGGWVTGSEDRSVRVWSGETGEVEETLDLPAISVWGLDELA